MPSTASPVWKARVLRSASISQPLLAAGGQAAADRVAGQARRRQAVAGHLAGEVLAGLDQIALDDAVDEADPLGLLGLDGAPGQDQLERARLADQPRQALGPAIARDQAELDLGKAEPWRCGAASRKVQASASSSPPPNAYPLISAIDGIGRWSSLANTAWPSAAPARWLDERAAHQLLDVGAGAKSAVAGAGHQQRARIAVGDLVERRGRDRAAIRSSARSAPPAGRA